MRVFAKPEKMPDGPLLTRTHNFAQLRTFLQQDNHAHETLILGNDYTRVLLQPGLGRGYVEFIRVAENFCVVITDLDFAADCAFKYCGENWIRFNFNLSGTQALVIDGQLSTRVEPKTSHLMVHPEGVLQGDRYFARTQGRWVSILCRKEHLAETFCFDPEGFPPKLKRFLAYGEASPYLNQRPMTAAMYRCVAEFFRQPSSLALRPLYLKGKAYDALYTFLEDLSADAAVKHYPAGLTRRDIDRLHEARAILEQQRGSEMTLAQLVRRVGLNRNKLSQGFHAVFGTTLMEFARLQRLEAAYVLLRDTDLSVGQIAERCGYRHLSSFTAAFKLQFDRSPRAMRERGEWTHAPDTVPRPIPLGK